MLWKDKREKIFFALIFLAGFLLYGKSLSAPFILDDYPSIVDNPAIKHLDLTALWRRDPSRFLTNFSFAVNYALHGLQTTGWHIVNVLLHCACAAAVFQTTHLILQMPRVKYSRDGDRRWSVSCAAALLFFVHPIQTQAVINIVQRSTLLASLFYFLSVGNYLRGRITNENKYYYLSVVCALLGMLSKPLAMTLPVMIIALDVLLLGIEKKPQLKSIIVVAVLGILAALVPAWFIGIEQLGLFAGDGIQNISWLQRLLSECTIIFKYFGLLIFPVGQNIDYDFPAARHLWEWPAALSVLGVAGLLGLAVGVRRRSPFFLLGTAWFLITLSPVVIFPFADLIFEHWAYLPSYGFFLAAVVFGERALKNIKSFWIVAAVWIAVLAALTWSRAALWQDPLALMQDTARKSPNKARVHNNLGLIQWEQGKIDEAKASFQTALQLDPEYVLPYNNLASMFLKERNFSAAEELLKKAIEKVPQYLELYVNLGYAYEGMGDLQQAAGLFNFVIRGGGQNSAAYVGMGNVLQRTGQIVEAKKHFQKAIWLRPENASAYYNLGNVFFEEKNFYEALLNYDKALALDPKITGAYLNSGNIYFYFQDNKNAVAMYQKAVAVDPGSAEAYLNLANALYADGKPEESRQAAEKALGLYEAEGNTQRAEEIRKALKDS